MAPKGDVLGKRNKPRRLFSFDSIKSSSTRRSSSEASASDPESSRLTRPPLKLPNLHQVKETKDEEGVFGDGAGTPSWMEKELVESPQGTPSSDDNTFSLRASSPGPEKASQPATRSNQRRPTPLSTNIISRPETPESHIPPSPSRARWEHLRQHVLPVVPVQPSTPPTHSQQPSSASSLNVPPVRPQTPKPSRLARLGFRQVVEHVREVAVDDTRRFAYEIQKACWSARYVEPSKTSKAEREPHVGTVGSSLYLPFMSSTSLPMTPNASTTNFAQASNKKHEMHRPQSVQSLALSNRSVPSLKYLYQTLLHGTTSLEGQPLASTLPYESQVLSTMLGPFLTPETGVRVEEERWFAIGAFETIVKFWYPIDESGGIERCLWCCKAALIPPSTLRTRILSSLWEILLARETRYPATTPIILQTLLQALFSLLPSLYSPTAARAETQDSKLLKDIISQVELGRCGELDITSIEEEYNAIFIANDDLEAVRKALITEALVRCLENWVADLRRWMLKSVLEEYWPVPPEDVSYTPLLTSIHTRKLNTFTRAALALLLYKSSDHSKKRQDAEAILHLIQTRVLPELQGIHGNTATETKANVSCFALELLTIENEKELARWSISLICRWYRELSEWKPCFETNLQNLILNSDWPTVLKVLPPLIKMLPDNVRENVVAFSLPVLNERLVADPPAYPCLPLTELMENVAELYPRVFYKPLFACAASSKEFTVVNHLCTITVISRFLPDFWIRNADMLSVALMSDVGGVGAKTANLATDPAASPVWGAARLGQSVLLLEVIGRIQAVRRDKELSSSPDHTFVETVKFVLALEARLSLGLEAKERTNLVPPSQRLLFCILFREIRLLTRSLKTASWLSRVVKWFINFHLDDDIHPESNLELENSVGLLQTLYATAQEGARASHKRRSTMLLSPPLDGTTAADISLQGADMSAVFAAKAPLIASLSKGFVPRALKLLVAMSALLTTDDYRRIGPILWEKELNGTDPKVIASACFLIMRCAEKIPLELLAIIEVDMHSSNDDTKLGAIRRISTLSNWRFQILSQHIVMDRAHRPFKLTRGPLPFVATDMGSSLFVHQEDPNELKDSLPSELRKRLADIGWAQEDRPVDQQLERIKTPISLLPASQMDRMDGGSELSPASPSSPSPSPGPSPKKGASGDGLEEGGLLRRNSSTGGPLYGMKRRVVFVPSLAMTFPRLASLIFDPNFAIASAARITIVDLMRNDPVLLTRPVLDLFAGDEKDISAAISTLRAFLHVRHVLPPPMAHNVFNNLAGFLKFASREVETSDTLHDFAHVIPVLSKLVTQVSDMSIRDIRRAKFEAFLIPSGSLWFSSTSPAGPMFPRSLGTVQNPFEHWSATSGLVSITMIRLSQNMLFLAMLKRNHQDVQLIRKNMSRLVLPSWENNTDATPLELKDFAPHKIDLNDCNSMPIDVRLRGLSLMLSRSYLLLVAQVFRSMSRHLNDRNELAVLIDGLNRVLLTHGDDIGIVGQAMIALMVASTRFRRLFTSGGGYTLFMPVLIKIYAESESHVGIRLAIEYAVNRFYALHREAFVFQSLDIIGHVTMVPGIDGDWLARSVYSLFSTLRRGIPPSTPDVAGIHNANKLQEREALMVTTAEEKPQTFLASLRPGGTNGKDQVTIDLPEEYETRRLGIDNFVRLFLTVIAHDPSILRAEQFLRFFRYITPYLHHASSSARSVLREGIDALGVVLTKAAAKVKATESASTRSSGDASFEFLSSEAVMENHLLEKSKTASDIASMRLDYLSLIVAFTRAGGQLGTAASQRTFDLIKAMLKDSINDINEPISAFFSEYVKTTLIRENPLSPKEVVTFLKDLAPIITAYAVTVDFSAVFETVSLLTANPIYANEAAFSQLVVTQICAAGLAACELAASEKLLWTLPFRCSLVSLLAQSVFLRGADVIAEVERRSPSSDFLAGLVLPLVMLLKTGSQIVSEGARNEAWHRNVHASAWIRLLSYAMSACSAGQRTPDSSHFSERTKSQDKRRSSSSSSQIMTLVTALQVIKAIIIRAEADVSACLPGVWSRVASFLKSILVEGSAHFALTYPERSNAPSPVPSPRTSAQFSQSIPSSMSSTLRSPSLHGRTFLSPRIVDYCLWSILELLCLRRSPLMLQMQAFMQEKIVGLDQELRFQQSALSPATSNDRRISASIFSKPRRRLSGLPSPDTSPRLSSSFSHELASPSSVGRQAGYQNFPLSPSQESYGPRIVHLGPISNPSSSVFPRSHSPGGGGGVRLMAKSTKVKSLSLVQATYRRIRVVQTFMGYDLLLPMPNNERDVDIASMRTWSKKQALDVVTRETKELMEEFEESLSAAEDDLVIVDHDQS